MLRSEKSSNNEQDDSPTLLSKDLQLSLTYDQPEFSLDAEQAQEAYTISSNNQVEEQVLVYFAGYVLHKLDSWHVGDCETCDLLGEKHKGNAEKAQAEIAKLQEAAIQNQNVFETLMEASKYCSLGQITDALFEVGGQYRRNM